MFWDEFWVVYSINRESRRERVGATAEAAGKIGAVLRLAFRRNADGSSAEEVLVSGIVV